MVAVQLAIRIEGKIRGFDEFMNLVVSTIPNQSSDPKLTKFLDRRCGRGAANYKDERQGDQEELGPDSVERRQCLVDSELVGIRLR